MTQESDHAMLEKFFDQALSLDSADRESWLKTVKQSHPGLHGPLLSLLKAHTTQSAFLTREPAGILTQAPFEAPAAIAHYTLEALIGEGVSGKVFRALDKHLKRPVAIKWIPDKGSEHEIFQHKVQQEAELLASLEHPNIASIYGVEHSDRDHAIVMEYIDGHTLAERLQQGPLPLDEAIKMAVSISHAVEAAHAKGIVHRDLKPGNIKINSRNEIKVLDFGLSALITDLHGLPVAAASGDTSMQQDETASLLTQTAIIMGTLPYLSPEQARGRPLDQRSDIWSFGCVLFEMLTGKILFTGQDPVETLSNILKMEIPWEALPADTPKNLRWLLEKCLRRDVQRRLPDMGAARIDLEDILLQWQHASDFEYRSTPQSIQPRRGLLPWSIAGLACIILCCVIWLSRPHTPSATQKEAQAQPTLSLPIYFTESDHILSRFTQFLLTPRSDRLILRTQKGILVHPLDHVGPTAQLNHHFVQEPFISPEGDRIAYLDKNKLYLHSLETHERTVLCNINGNEAPNHGGGLWRANGELIFNTGDQGLFKVQINGHEPPELVLPTTDQDDNFHEANALPEGRGLIFITHRRHHAIDTVTIWSEETGRKELLQLKGYNLNNPVYAPSGHILFYIMSARKMGLWAFPFDLATLTRTGEIFKVTDKASFGFAVSAQNTLIYHFKKPIPTFRLRWIQDDGTLGSYLEGTLDRQWISGLDISPDQKHILFGANEDLSSHFWQYDIARQTSSRIRSFQNMNWLASPHWLNQKQIVFRLWDDQGVRTFFGGTDYTDKQTLLSPGHVVAVSKSGRYVLVQGYPRWGRHAFIDMESENRSPQPFSSHLDDVWNPALSHDNQWMAFVSGEQRKDDSVYVVGFPDASIRYVINQGYRAIHPFWHPSRNTLYYIDPEAQILYNTHFMPEPAPAFTPPAKVIDLPKNMFYGNRYFPRIMTHVPATGQFLYIERQLGDAASNEGSRQPDAILVQNWNQNLELTR